MPGHELLRDIVLILAAAVAVVGLLGRLKVPSIAGFLVVGAMLGPGGFGFVRERAQVEVLAEIGVAMLLFGIGMELSLDRMRRLWRPIVLGGGLQVGITLAATWAIGVQFGLSHSSAIFLGCLVAPSSTAIVLRGLQASGEIDAPHGRLTLGVLVFQDLLVVPMMLAIPLLAGTGGGSGAEILWTMAKAIGLLAGLLAGASFLVPKALHLVAMTRQRDLFVLAVVLICLGTAYLVSGAGISLALGAFLGGLAVSGSDYRHQALGDLLPLREVLASVFFVSAGMLLDPAAILADPLPVFLMTAGILIGKFAVVLVIGAILRLPLSVAILAGAALCQVGEFAFVLEHAAEGTGLMPGRIDARFASAAGLTMILTPLAIAFAPHLAAGVGRMRSLTQEMGVRPAREAEEGSEPLVDHVIVAGFGMTGQELARSLRAVGARFLLVDLNPANVRRAAKEGAAAFFGDITSDEVLHLVGAEHARELVLLLNDPTAEERAIRAARRLAPKLRIVVRTRYLADRPRLIAAGADVVVAAELAAAVEVASALLARDDVDGATARNEVDRIRGRRAEPTTS